MSKKKRLEAVAERCQEARRRVQVAVENHQAGRPEDLNIEILENVRADLSQMSKILDKNHFRPSYGRYLLDWPDEHGLVEYLLGVAQDYCRWT